MSKQADELQERSRQFALDVFALIKQLPPTDAAVTVRRQVAKSASSIHFNYRAARRSRTHTEFTGRIAIVAEEADETLGWLNFISDSKLLQTPALKMLINEAKQLVAIFSASYATARRNEEARKSEKKRRTRGQ